VPNTPNLTSEGAARQLASINDELTELQQTRSLREALDASRSDLGKVTDLLGKTAEDLEAANEQLEKAVEQLKDPSSRVEGSLSAEGLADRVEGLADESSFSSLKAAVEAAKGVLSDMEGAGDVAPEEAKAQLKEFSDAIGDVMDNLGRSTRDMSSRLQELLETDGAKKLIEGTKGGLTSTTNIIKGINDGLTSVDGVLGDLQTLDDLASGNAQQQLNALATALERLTGLFGDLITAIPGLGAFLTLYANAFRGAAISAGIISGVADRDQRIYEMIREGKYLRLTDEALLADRIRKLEYQRAQVLDEGLAAATQERLDREEAANQTTATDRDIAVETAIRGAEDALPELNSDAYQVWVQSSSALDVAQAELEAARINLSMTHQELREAQIAAQRRDGSVDAATATARVGMAESAVKRAKERFRSAGEGFDAAQTTHRDATAAHHAEVGAYNDAVRQGVIDNAAKTNSGRGFSESDWYWFNSTYPQWRVTEADLAPASPPAQAEPVAAAVGVGATAVEAGTKPNRWRPVMIGGAGLLGAAIVLGGILWISNTGEVSTTAPPSQDQAGSEQPESDPASDTGSASDENPPPAADDEDVDVCAASALGCADFGEAIVAFGTVAWDVDPECEDPLTEGGESVMESFPNGLHVFIPGAGYCGVGDGGVVCGGVSERGSSQDSSGTITILGSTSESTGVTGTGFTGMAQQWEAPAGSDGAADLDNRTCTRGGAFTFSTDAATWQAALASPTATEPPIQPGNFACIATPTETGVVITWLVDVAAAVPESGSPFVVDLYARLGDWARSPAGALAAFGPNGVPTVTLLGEDGVVREVSGDVYTEILRAELAARITEELGDDADALALIDELGLDVTDPEAAMEQLAGTDRVLIVGQHEFDPSNSQQEADALDGFGVDTVIDAQVKIANGVFGSFAASNVCRMVP
jgi:hypothetical protein